MKCLFYCLLACFCLNGVAFGYRVDVKPGDDLTVVRNRIREARKTGVIAPNEMVEIVLASGNYVLKSPLSLEKADSGVEAAPVIWRAAEKEGVHLRGAATIAPADFKSVAAPLVLKRFPEEARAHIRAVSIKTYFKTLPKVWDKTFSHVPNAPWAYAHGEAMELARWPNADANDLTGPEPQEKGWCWFTNAVDLGVNPNLPGRAREYPIRPGAIRFTHPHAYTWNLEDGVWMYGYWVHDWFAAYQRVGSFTPSNQVVRFADKVMFGVGGSTCGGNKRRFIVINAPEELDAPGEWWFDRKTGVFYCWPRNEAEDIVVALDTQLVTVKGAHDIRFEGLAFEYTHSQKSAVSVSASDDVVFSRCTFRHHASTGLLLAGGYGCRAEDCLFEGFGGNVVSLQGGDRRWLVPARHALVRCDISHYAKWNRQAMPITLGGCGMAVRQTRVHDGPCGAVAYGGNDHLIADNEFDHVMLEACDAGAIYTGRNASTQGHLIFGNYLHDLSREYALRIYRSAFYFDDCDWGDDAIGNHVRGVGLGTHVGGGSMHGIYNNLFEDCTKAITMGSRGWSWKRAWRGSFAVNGKTGLGWAESDCAPFEYHRAPWSVAYPMLGKWLSQNPEVPHGNVFSNNVFVVCGKQINVDKRARESNGLLPDACNVVITNLSASPAVAPQKVQLRDARKLALTSGNQNVEACFDLDVAGRLSWAMKASGKTLVRVSTLGITVDERDLGKKVVPQTAIDFVAGSGAFFTNCWRLLPSGAEAATNFVVGAWKGASMPLQDLVTGAIVAYLDARVWDNGVAYRWRVPGTGNRTVFGEMGTWIMASDTEDKVCIMEADRNETWPEFYVQARCKGVRGIVFPERPRGWQMTGDVVTPWRVTTVR